MPRLTLQQVLTLTDTSFQKFQTLRRRDQIAMAFGRRLAAASLSYIPLDCVGMLLVATLGEAYGGKLTFPAQLVRVHGDVWFRAVAYSEAEARSGGTRDAYFCVIDLERESDGKAGHEVMGYLAADPDATVYEPIRDPLPPGWVRRRINCVSVSLLIRRVRKAAYNKGKAAEEQINLDAPFLPTPGSDEYKKLLACDYFKGRDQVLTEMKLMKSREAAAAKYGDIARAMVLQ
jgi:hypothetical protein